MSFGSNDDVVRQESDEASARLSEVEKRKREEERRLQQQRIESLRKRKSTFGGPSNAFDFLDETLG